MSSFLKPKTHRSNNSCCICNGKISSSSYKDSRKCEIYVVDPLQLTNRCRKELCHTCARMVNHYKKRPAGLERRWHHMQTVTIRGTLGDKCIEIHRKRHRARNYETAFKRVVGSEEEFSSTDNEVSEVHPIHVASKRKSYVPVKRKDQTPVSIVQLDPEIWKKENVCCGTTWNNSYNQVVLNDEHFKPCPTHFKNPKLPKDTDLTERKLFSDNSSDSGYESSVSHLLHKKIGLLNDIKPIMPMNNQEFDENMSKSQISKKPVSQKRIILIKKVMPDKSTCTVKPMIPS